LAIGSDDRTRQALLQGVRRYERAKFHAFWSAVGIYVLEKNRKGSQEEIVEKTREGRNAMVMPERAWIRHLSRWSN